MKSPALLAETGRRRLGHPQMAFVRSWAEGLDLTQSWNRYLYVDGAADARRARGELQRLLDELRNLARAHGRPDLFLLLVVRVLEVQRLCARATVAEAE